MRSVNDMSFPQGFFSTISASRQLSGKGQDGEGYSHLGIPEVIDILSGIME